MAIIAIFLFIIWIFVKTAQAEKESQQNRQHSKDKNIPFYTDGYGKIRDVQTGKKANVFDYMPKHKSNIRIGEDGRWTGI